MTRFIVSSTNSKVSYVFNVCAVEEVDVLSLGFSVSGFLLVTLDWRYCSQIVLSRHIVL